MSFVLHKILLEKDLDTWSKLKPQYFETPYLNIYQLINKFYEKFTKLPSFNDLEVIIRDDTTLNTVQALKEATLPDVPIEVLLQALINEYAQRYALRDIEKFVDTIIFKDAAEMVQDMSDIAVDLEEKIESSEQIVKMTDFITIDKTELLARIPLGLNNDFDQMTFGIAPTEYIMFGGYRGSGKSIICSNIVCNQYIQGNSSLYFTIEMRGRELYQRNLAILTEIPHSKIKSGNLTFEEQMKIAVTKAEMTESGVENLLTKFEKDKDFVEFERSMINEKLNKETQLITVDNSKLTLANIDATIQKYKYKFEDKLKVVVVDYINQIYEEDSYRWDKQIEISKRLKAMARKYEIIMITPFQIDEKGGVRFSKGILDSPDWAFNIQPSDNSIAFECKKVRGAQRIDFESTIDWEILKIRPNLIIPKNEILETEDDLKVE